MIKIALLADHPETILTLAQWFRAEWPDYFAGRTPADIAEDFVAEANREGVPVRLVAFAGSELAGTVTLRELAFSPLPQYHPGLGGLFVVETYRGQGVGSELVRATMDLAQKQGYERIYAATVNARGILQRLGWEHVQAVSHGDEQTALYRCELEKRNPSRPE